MVSLPGLWSLVIINVSKLFVGFWVYPNGTAADLLEGTLKLRYCNTIFAKRFPLGLPGVVMGVVKGV